MVIDSHVHFWKYKKGDYPWIDNSMKILQKDHLPTDIQLTLKRNNVDGCIAIQATSQQVESRFLAELATTNPIIKGVVAWADLRAPDVERKLTELKEYSSIVGIRHVVQTEADDFLYNEDFRRGISVLKEFNYTYDILIFPKQLKAATDFVRNFPEQTFIIDHCAKPDIKGREMNNWKSGITDLAMFPNVSCKVSGLLTEASWKEWHPAEFYPYLDIVFESFGPERVLFGSDWPVILLSGIYVQWKSLLDKYMEGFLQEDKEMFYGLNAQRLYGI
jgi:L-fuconolactonase